MPQALYIHVLYIIMSPLTTVQMTTDAITYLSYKTTFSSQYSAFMQMFYDLIFNIKQYISSDAWIASCYYFPYCFWAWEYFKLCWSSHRGLSIWLFNGKISITSGQITIKCAIDIHGTHRFLQILVTLWPFVERNSVLTTHLGRFPWTMRLMTSEYILMFW